MADIRQNAQGGISGAVTVPVIHQFKEVNIKYQNGNRKPGLFGLFKYTITLIQNVPPGLQSCQGIGDRRVVEQFGFSSAISNNRADLRTSSSRFPSDIIIDQLYCSSVSFVSGENVFL